MRGNIIKRLENISTVYERVIWNKEHTGFIGYDYCNNMYLMFRDYVYIKDGVITVAQSAVEQ